jgi:hypothetical protein
VGCRKGGVRPRFRATQNAAAPKINHREAAGRGDQGGQMRAFSIADRRAVWAALLLAPILIPGAAEADCEILPGNPVLAGMMRAGHAADGSFRFYANVFNGGSGDELNVGANRAIGFLPPGQTFAIHFATATADSSTRSCIFELLEADVTSFSGPNCTGSQTRSETHMYVINTCATQVLWRSQTSLIFPSVPFSPSIKTETFVKASDLAVDAKDGGCFNVSPENRQGSCGE